MNRIIILLIFIYFTYCTVDSCLDEKDYSKCENNDIGISKISCYKLRYHHDPEEQKTCIPFPDEAESQKAFNYFSRGIIKEFASSSNVGDKFFSGYILYVTEKETYNKGEAIHSYPINGTIPLEDMDRLMNKNTCSYKYFGRYVDNKANLENNIPYENITDKNICFNVDQFDELKDLLNCGYAEIKYVKDNKEYGIKTCFLIPDSNMPDEIRKLYKKYVDMIFEVGIFPLTFDSFDPSKKEKLEKVNYEIIVEDKNGKKLEYIYGSEDIVNYENKNNPNDNTQTDNTKTDNTQTGNTQTDNTQTDNTQTDNTQTGNTQTDNTQTDNTKTDNTQSGNNQSGNTQSDKTQSDDTQSDEFKIITPNSGNFKLNIILSLFVIILIF